jgi:tetratricopeptide (TPR) repeat protein
VVAYAFDAPAGARAPFRVDAALRHRSRDAALQAAACADARSERGQAFAASSRELLGTFLDPCTPQPITEIARASVAIGAGATTVWTWRQHFAHALGLGHAVSERLDEARAAYQAALATLAADPTAGAHERAAVLAGLGQIAGKQGRLDEAIGRFDQAQALWPDHPAIAYLRGEAYAGVWRWAQAAPLLAAAAARSPMDDLAWSRAATAYQSLGQPIVALAVAQRGLLAQPRSADLLRIQALALRLLAAPAAIAEAAFEAWVVRHPADDSPRYRSMCQKRDPGCVRERNPVHVHLLAGRATVRTSTVDTPNSPR